MTVNLPRYLQRTPEELAEEAKVQELRKASFGRAHMTRAEELVSRGALLEETARGNLAAGENTISLLQLAEGLAMQGRYSEAAQHSPDPEMKTRYEAVSAAIEMDDEEKCECPDIEGNVDGVAVGITPRFVGREVYSQKHEKLVSLITCWRCGHANAREPKSRLLLPATKQNLAAAKSDGRGAVRDSQLLKKE